MPEVHKETDRTKQLQVPFSQKIPESHPGLKKPESSHSIRAKEGKRKGWGISNADQEIKFILKAAPVSLAFSSSVKQLLVRIKSMSVEVE